MNQISTYKILITNHFLVQFNHNKKLNAFLFFSQFLTQDFKTRQKTSPFSLIWSLSLVLCAYYYRQDVNYKTIFHYFLQFLLHFIINRGALVRSHRRTIESMPTYTHKTFYSIKRLVNETKTKAFNSLFQLLLREMERNITQHPIIGENPNIRRSVSKQLFV